MDKLKIPPLTKAAITVYFDNNLKISENKSIFFEQIKSNFPKIIYPENKFLKYPMGDISFFAPAFDKVIEVNANSFSLSDFKYQDFKNYLELFKDNFTQFNKIYGIDKFNSFNLMYENSVVLNKNIGEKFNDYFTIEFNFKSDKEKTFIATMGNFAFKVKDGLLSVEISPVISDKNITEKFKFSITFLSAFSSSVNLEKLLDSVSVGHEFIDDLFEKSLTENYLKTIRN